MLCQKSVQIAVQTGAAKGGEKLGVSQEEFADLCGLDRTYVGGIERGERNVSLVNIEKIAQTFKVSLSDLFRGV